MNFLTQFAAEGGIHISLKGEDLFEVGGFMVTNSILYGVICAIMLAFLLRFAAKRVTMKAGQGVVGLVENLVEFVIGLLEGPLLTRERAAKYMPVIGFFFIFVMFNNLMGIIPIVGPAITYSGVEAGTPLFRPFTADINGTIAMSVIAIILVQYLSIKEQGGKGHLAHYFTNQPWNPINFFIGILEVFGEFTRILSLALRLFLNTAVGEILIAVFTSMISANGQTPIAVIPILLFELLVAGIQAYVFTLLTATYLGLATAHHADHDDGHDEAHNDDHAATVEEAHASVGTKTAAPAAEGATR